MLSLDLYDTSSEDDDIYMNGVLLSNGLAEADDKAALNDFYRGDLPYVEPVSAARDAMQPLRLPNLHRSPAADLKPAVAAIKPELPPGLPPFHGTISVL